MRDRIHHFWTTSNDHFIKQIHFFSNQKLFGSYTSMIIYIQNSCVFCGEFLVSHSRLRTLKHFHRLLPLELCLTTNTRSFTPMGYLSLLAITRHQFSLPLYSTVRLCWTSSNLTEPTQSITKRNVDFQLCTHTHLMQCPHAYSM